VTVFELSNDALREFYLCVSALSLAELITEQCARPPRAIVHWKWRKSADVFYSEIEVLPDEKQALAFMAQYAAVLARTGWKVVR
jgi:hypothetical protein